MVSPRDLAVSSDPVGIPESLIRRSAAVVAARRTTAAAMVLSSPASLSTNTVKNQSAGDAGQPRGGGRGRSCHRSTPKACRPSGTRPSTRHLEFHRPRDRPSALAEAQLGIGVLVVPPVAQAASPTTDAG